MAEQQKGIVNIRGKEYKTVGLRVSEFHEWNRTEAEGQYCILPSIIEHNDQKVIAMAEIVVAESGVVVARGYAEEFRSAGPINKTSALENAETSAIGRALACFGFGGTEYASANEVENAQRQQRTLVGKEKADRIKAHIEAGRLTNDHLFRVFGHASISKLLDVEADRILNAMSKFEEANNE